jgi:hypothetical protein
MARYTGAGMPPWDVDYNKVLEVHNAINGINNNFQTEIDDAIDMNKLERLRAKLLGKENERLVHTGSISNQYNYITEPQLRNEVNTLRSEIYQNTGAINQDQWNITNFHGEVNLGNNVNVNGALHVRDRHGTRRDILDIIEGNTGVNNPIIGGEGILVTNDVIAIDMSFIDRLKAEIAEGNIFEDYDDICRENKILEAENTELRSRLEVIELKLGII